jgi:hypothetical protein
MVRSWVDPSGLALARSSGMSSAATALQSVAWSGDALDATQGEASAAKAVDAVSAAEPSGTLSTLDTATSVQFYRYFRRLGISQMFFIWCLASECSPTGFLRLIRGEPLLWEHGASRQSSCVSGQWTRLLRSRGIIPMNQSISMTSRRCVIYCAKRWPNRAVSAMPGERTGSEPGFRRAADDPSAPLQALDPEIRLPALDTPGIRDASELQGLLHRLRLRPQI